MSLFQTPRWYEDRRFDRFTLSFRINGADVDRWLWRATRPVQLKSVNEKHSAAGGVSAAVRPRKITAAQTGAPGQAAGANVKELTTAVFDLTLSVDVNRAGTLVSTIADLQFNVGDWLALDFSGTVTPVEGALVFEFQEIKA